MMLHKERKSGGLISMMTIGSLFSGIGGLELGLEWAGHGPVLWQCDSNPFSRAVLAKHWPDVKRYEDVTKLESLEYVDIICGGFPCQDVSSAGKQGGIYDSERSSLWWYFAAIIESLRPRFVVIENVASGKPHWLPPVRKTMHMLGYRTRAIQLSARDVGAIHTRERIFVIADTDSFLGSGIRTVVANEHSKNTRKTSKNSLRIIPKTSVLETSGEKRLPSVWTSPMPKRRTGRVAHGIFGDLDPARIYSLGNAVVPQCSYVIGKIIEKMA